MPQTIASILLPEQVFGFLQTNPEYGDDRKASNYHKLAEARQRADLIVDAVPARIRLEAHAACNLRCCWAQRNPKHPGLRPRGAADPELARRIIREIGDRLYHIDLFHWGEPLLNPRLPELVRLFHEARIHVGFHTNITLMNAEMAARLVEAGLDHINASIDGVSQDAYGQYRAGGKVANALRGLRILVEQRRRLGRSNPIVQWQYLVFPHNEHEIDRARELATEIGVDKFYVLGGSGRSWTADEGLAEPDNNVVSTAHPACGDPWDYLAVDWDGAVHLCCRAFQARHVMGHMRDDDLSTIFNNSRYQLARRVIRDLEWQGGEEAIPCTGCSVLTRRSPQIAALGHSLTQD